MRDDLLEAWRTNNRINLFLIDKISAAGMKCSLSKRGGRDVARQFAHMHNVRVWHLEKRARDLAEGLAEFETKVTPTKTQLRKALSASGKAVESFLEGVIAGKAVESFLEGVIAGNPKRRGFKKGIFATLGYFVAHESHHRGSILLTLKECGHNIDKGAQYAIWGWDQM